MNFESQLINSITNKDSNVLSAILCMERGTINQLITSF